MAALWRQMLDLVPDVLVPRPAPEGVVTMKEAVSGGAPVSYKGHELGRRRAAGERRATTLLLDAEKPGSDGRNRTADLGVMNPSL